MANTAMNVIEGPEPGVILEGRYMLVERRAAVAGRPSYLARDLIDDVEVEVIVTGEDRIGQPRFRVRGRARAAAVVGRRRRRRTLRDAVRQAAAESRAQEASTPTDAAEDDLSSPGVTPGVTPDTIVNRIVEADIEHDEALDAESEALESLRAMVALSGPPQHEGHAVVYRGTERSTGRAVRVTVELDG